MTHTETTCAGEGGYDDLHEGTQIEVTDEANVTLGIGSFDQGTFAEMIGCTWRYEVSGLPKAKFYKIALSGGRRGTLTYSFEEMEKRGWSVDLQVGMK